LKARAGDNAGFRRRLKDIRPSFPRDLKCDFHPSRSGIPVTAIAPIIDAVIAPNYSIGGYEPYFAGDGERPDYKQQGTALLELVGDLTQAEDDDIARAIVNQLIDDDPADARGGGETFYADDQSYVRYESTYNPRSEAWDQFKFEITYNRRFFSDIARARLGQIFEHIHLQKDDRDQPVVYQLGAEADAQIYRARQIINAGDREKAIADPANLLGTPPRRYRAAGRMNAAGVPAFYAAFEFDTCLAEIRPSVGSQIVGAAFRIVRPLVVLDTTRFERPSRRRSIFSVHYTERLQQWSFMQRFMYEISQPVLPGDTLLDYIPTQAVAEFICNELEVYVCGDKRKIDAIIFSSAQRPNGRNIVIFGDAAVVENSESARDATAPEPAVESSDIWTSWRFEPPAPGLAVVDGSVRTHHVTGVSFAHEALAEFAEGEDLF
jgi:hypothetical protein